MNYYNDYISAIARLVGSVEAALGGCALLRIFSGEDLVLAIPTLLDLRFT
jgi:hypothetical protein